MEREGLYLDTSVPSAYLDSQWPGRQSLTQNFWQTVMPDFDVYVSQVTLIELRRTPNSEKRSQLMDLVRAYPVLEVTREAEALAETFLKEDMVPPDETGDALHLAVAVVQGIDILVSWNFQHMVNFRTKRFLPMLAAKHGYFKQLLIVSPQEFSGEETMIEQPQFTPDSMMDELHQVRRQIHEETAGMDVATRLQWYRDQAMETAKMHNCELLPSATRPHTYRLVPSQEAANPEGSL